MIEKAIKLHVVALNLTLLQEYTLRIKRFKIPDGKTQEERAGWKVKDYSGIPLTVCGVL